MYDLKEIQSLMAKKNRTYGPEVAKNMDCTDYFAHHGGRAV